MPLDRRFGDEAAVDELTDPSHHDGATQACPCDQVRARARSTEPDFVEDLDEGVERLVGKRDANRIGPRTFIDHEPIIRPDRRHLTRTFALDR